MFDNLSFTKRNLPMKRALTLCAVAGALSACSVTPKPLTSNELNFKADQYLASLTENQEPVSGPIDLYEAMARALKYNLDKRVEMMERALRSRELDVENYNMLPQLVANVAYDGRSNDSGASSLSLLSGRQSLEPSTSSERNTVKADLNLSWDILDFGLSKARAHQAADEVLIAQENKRKVVNRIIEDVRTAYWRALSSQRLLTELSSLEIQIAKALKNSRSVSGSRTSSPIKALTYQRELITMRRDIQRLHRELRLAKVQLAALMNLPSNADYALVVPKRSDDGDALVANRDDMIRFALLNRPELREVAYRSRINEKEARVAYLESLPSLRGFIGINYDSNDYLYKNNWVGWGAKASWNLLKVFSYGDRKQVVQARDELLKVRALALSMAVMTQVDVSLARHEHMRRELQTAGELTRTQESIYRNIERSHRSGRVSLQTLIRERTNQLLAEVKYDVAYADLENAYANVFASVGINPWGANIKGDETVAQMAQALRALWTKRRSKMLAI